MNTMLEFVSVCDERKDSHILWICKCSCGDLSKYIASRVRNLRVLSCKKCASKRSAQSNKTHGMRNTPEYRAWQSAKNRCTNPRSKDYSRYYGAGIRMSDEFINSFESFFDDIGIKPYGTSIDRIDNTKGYEKGNIRWATRSQQQINKSSSYRWIICGIEYESCYAAANAFGVKAQTIIKWTDGYFDKRRGTSKKPKEDCYRIKRYE